MLNIAENSAVFNNTKLCNSLFYCIGKIGRFLFRKIYGFNKSFCFKWGEFPLFRFEC